MLLYGDKVGEALHGMTCGGFHAHHGAPGVAHELVQHILAIICLAVGERCEGAHANDIAVSAHYGYCLKQMLGFVAVHHHSPLRFEFPGALIHVEHHGVHTQVHGSFLRREACAETGVEENHEEGAVFP